MTYRERRHAIDQARAELAAEQLRTGDKTSRVVVCHGEPRCDRKGPDWRPCEWCYLLDPLDKRTTERVLKDMAVEH